MAKAVKIYKNSLYGISIRALIIYFILFSILLWRDILESKL